MSMWIRTPAEASNNQFWGTIILRGRHIIVESEIETMEEIERELSKLGYSKKAIKQILKWIPASA